MSPDTRMNTKKAEINVGSTDPMQIRKLTYGERLTHSSPDGDKSKSRSKSHTFSPKDG